LTALTSQHDWHDWQELPAMTGKPDRLFFDEDQWLAVEALTARIIPTDHDPGAREANVVGFIDRYLAGIEYTYANAWGSGFLALEGRQAEAWQARNAKLQDRYRQGLRQVAEVSQRRFGSSFIELSDEQQDAVLRVLARGLTDTVATVAGNADSDSSPETDEVGRSYEVAMSQPVTDDELTFFDTLVLHTRCGFYGDPAYGGNRDFVGWKTIGFAGPKSLAETNDGRYSTLEYMTGGEYAADYAASQSAGMTNISAGH
jgi:gluconate 2-dehydrogenase gamma chain